MRVSWSTCDLPPSMTRHPTNPGSPDPPKQGCRREEVRQAGGQAGRQAGPGSRQGGEDTILMVALRREGQTILAQTHPGQSSRLAGHEHRFLIRRTQSGLRRIIIDLHRAKQQGLGGDPYHRGTSVELQDPDASQPPLPARLQRRYSYS